MIRDVRDLDKILNTQKIVIARVKEEQIALLKGISVENPEDIARLVKLQKRLLSRYAAQPTLNESVSLTGAPVVGSKWGATFGVTILVQDYLLTQVELANPTGLGATLKHLFIAYLQELQDSKHDYIVESLKGKATFQVKDELGNPVEGAVREKLINDMLSGILKFFIVVSDTYELVREVKPNSFAVTPLGIRVYKHLKASHEYVEEIMSSHKRFQNAKPRLSLI